MDCENSTGNSGSGKSLTLSSHMQYALCTDCGISQAGITKMIGLYNHSKYGDRMRHIPENGHRWYIISFVSHFCSSSTWTKNYQDLKIHISTRKSPLWERNFSPSWRNTLVHLLLDTMFDSTAWITIITNIISSNKIPHMVVPFLLVPLHWQEKCQETERKRVKTEMNRFKPQNKTQNWMLPQISSCINSLTSKRVA